jgi:phage terminase large subunit GpA-like protein
MAADDDNDLATALADVCSPFQALRPPRRIPVSQGAAETLVFASPGAKGGPWDPTETPYMPEPMDVLASRRHEAEVFVGPARTGKTGGLLLGWMTHNARNDPGDMLFIQMTQDKAREFSKTDVDRALRHSKQLEDIKPWKQNDNTHDKMFQHGMWLRIAWPTASNVSGSTYRYVAITDLDRMPNAENVDGEGPLFDLGRKRTTTFMSRGMTLVESSPGIPAEDPSWRPATPHEAPPVKGVLGIYNRSDRRRWYWRCPHCQDRFEAKPGLDLFNLPPEDQLLHEIREMDIDGMADDFGKRIVCPSCSSIIFAGEKQLLNASGKWISEAEILGRTPLSPIAGFWLGGVAAAYQKWHSLVHRYLTGLRDYAMTGSEETLKTTTNTDQGLPYLSMHLREAALKARAPEDRTEQIERYVVPEWTRLVMASVDVQSGTRPRFVVQVHAIGEHFEQQLVNRFTIFDSRRKGMSDEWAPLDPAAYPEDWDRITEEVIRSTYRTPLAGTDLKVLLTVIDTGGEDGVSDKALAYYRRLRKQGLQNRVRLYKGTGKPGAAEIRETKQGLNKDVPVFLCNSNLLADRVTAGMQRETPGPGFYHFPKVKHPATNPDGWITAAFFDELKAEVRNADGTYTQIRKRNETFDLCKMIYAGLLALDVGRKGFWDNPPAWALPLAENRELVTTEERREMKADLPVAQVPDETARPVKRERRIATSPYLGGR